jgi:DNA mismatch repair protein MutL
MTIHVLPDQLASQIAAGEVVERPSSVVKELVENAIDAGATVITIDVRGGGRDLIQVADNGDGIAADEVETAFLRHATSKLASADDLWAIRTLGFRGEALAAISAVSRVTIVSRRRDEGAGVRLVLDGGEMVDREQVGAPAGTVIAVENLFYNVPARLKFLKSATTEKRLIDEFVTRYALAYPGIRFRLSHDGRVTFQTTGSGATADVLLAAYGPETTRQLLEVRPGEASESNAGVERTSLAASRSGVVVRGYVSDPALTWAGRNHIQLFVNGRTIRDTRLTFAVVQAYHTLLPVGRFPFALLFIDVPPEEVDVNVHPTKVEVRFRDEGAMFGAVQRAVRGALLETAPARGLGNWPVAEQLPPGWAGFRPRGEQGDLPSSQLDIPWQLQGPGPEQPARADVTAPQLPGASETRLPIMRVIGQVGASYIIAEGPEGLYLIDQHAAHERILYEQFLAQRRGQEVASQGLVAAATIYLSPSQSHLVEENLPLLTALGFEIEPFGPNAFRVRAVPAILSRSDPAGALAAVVADLENETTPLQSETEALVIKRVCKTAAVRAGQTLSREEMEAMIQQLEACAVPHTCPHGRPTLIHLSAAQLARQFGRT